MCVGEVQEGGDTHYSESPVCGIKRVERGGPLLMLRGVCRCSRFTFGGSGPRPLATWPMWRERETRQCGEERGDNELLRYIDARFMRSPHVEGVDGMDSQI